MTRLDGVPTGYMRVTNNLGSGWEIRVGRVEALLWIAISLAIAYATYLAGISTGRAANQPPRSEATIVLEGAIESIKHRNAKTGFTVMQLKPKGPGESITMVGNFPQAQPGLKVRVEGGFVDHRKHGRQFVIKDMRLDYPGQPDTSLSQEDERAPGDDARSAPAADLESQPQVAPTGLSKE